MKRLVLMALLAMALPLTALAGSSVDFGNIGGTLTGSNSGLTLTGSELFSVTGLNGMGVVVSNTGLGSVDFTTAGFLTGNAQTGGTLAAGGSFVITGNGTNGIPNGVIFSGSFTNTASSPIMWSVITLANGTHQYTLQGGITGTWINGQTVSGASVQLTINTGKGFFNGSTLISSGDTNISAVPEPGTLGLLGTGLVGLAGALRRKKA
jgi:hypothetical protein